MGLKIWQRRSAFSLFRLNAWAAYAVLLLLAAGNWEVWMARYNLQPRFRALDIGFLLRMPPRVLPVLLARPAVAAQAPSMVADDGSGTYISVNQDAAQSQLRYKLKAFREQYQEHPNWQSRTVSEWLTFKTVNK